ncbi:MAG: zinc ABC transporter substrate-binding protein, partial [Acidobacteria bacterium]|nr:zinc ABC transporter substrate-binding protein [Acidobacteriota bacterium]
GRGQLPSWSPTAEVIASLGEADLIIASGAGYEKWTETATLPMSKFVNAAAALPLIEIEGVAHSHGPEGEHSHTGVDPHVFTDPLAYLAQAQSIHSALTAADPDGRAAYDANLAALRADLEALDAELKQVTAPLQSLALAANHPSFNYLARRYGLSIRTFDLDPEAAPAATTVAELEAWMTSPARRP